VAGVLGLLKFLGLSVAVVVVVIIRPAARERLGLLRWRACAFSAFSGVDASISDWKSDMLFGRADMSSQ
jgi:hypothetical protein